MLKLFFLVFDNEKADSLKIKHIQYNIQKKLYTLKYIRYGRIDVLFDIDHGGETETFWEHSRSARVKTGLDKAFVNDLSARDSIAGIYKSTVAALKILWDKNNWAKDDLDGLLGEAEKENY